MAIQFNNVPNTTRTPGTYVEIDNSRALKGLYANPHKALLIGQKTSSGTKSTDTLIAISKDNLADGYFGTGSILARMCNVFKANNPNTELYAMCLSANGGVKASGSINFSLAMSGATLDYAGTFYMMVNGENIEVALTSTMSGMAINSAVLEKVNTSTYSHLPVIISTVEAGSCNIIATQSGTLGNYINVRFNYYNYQSNPTGFSTDMSVVAFAGGATDPDLGDAWAVIDDQQFHYIIQPYIDSANLVEIEDELENRFGPLIDLQGHGFTAVRGTQASCTTLGNSRNSPYNTIVGAYDSPTCPEEWGAAWGAVAANALNQDPARPLTGLKLKGILPPPINNRFTRAERDVLLYDGIATYTVDSGGNVLIERSITTYQSNSVGSPDPSYLDVQTLATLGEIRYQFKTRMNSRFISPRFKLADDGFPVQPGSFVATPSVVKSEIISLFTLLRDKGLIENLEDFVNNLVVERDTTDTGRVNVLLPPDLINQFRVLAAKIQFIL